MDEKNDFRTQSLLCVPMITPDDVCIGVIQLINKKYGLTFDERDEQFLELRNQKKKCKFKFKYFFVNIFVIVFFFCFFFLISITD